MTYLKPGDIILTRGEGWLDEAVRRFSAVGKEKEAFVNHVGIVVRGGQDFPFEKGQHEAIIVEALSHVKRHPLRDQYGDGKTQIAIFRPKLINKYKISKIVKKANEYVGDSYGYIKIVAHLLDYFLGGAYFFRRLANMDKYPICSWLVAEAYASIGHNFGVPAGAASPDDIYDYCRKYKEEFEEIRFLKLW